MAGKTLDNRAPVSIDALKAKVAQKYTAHPFEHPEGYGIVELARLKRHEREAIQAASRRPDGMVDVAVQNRMAAAFGLVNPKLSAEELKEYPDDFIEPIADEVWRMSNEYRDRLTEDGKGGNEPAPFFAKNSSATDSPSLTAGPSTP